MYLVGELKLMNSNVFCLFLHFRYIGIKQKYQIPMYPKKEYIGTLQLMAIPMYPPLEIYQFKQPATSHNPDSGRISAQVITGSTVFRGLYTDSRKRMKASRPSGVHLYTPASSSTCRNTLPVSSLMMSIALSALNSGWVGRNSSTQSA